VSQTDPGIFDLPLVRPALQLFGDFDDLRRAGCADGVPFA
jgi:hypothetical protein